MFDITALTCFSARVPGRPPSSSWKWEKVCFFLTGEYTDSIVMIMSDLQRSLCGKIQWERHVFDSVVPFLLFSSTHHYSTVNLYATSLYFFFLLRIRQAKVQILPERVLPDPLSAVQLAPLSRLYMQPSPKAPSASSKQAQCWWNNYKQVRKNHPWHSDVTQTSLGKSFFGQNNYPAV